MNEEWRLIPRFNGHYSASNFGRVRREISATRAKAGHVMRLTNSRGYANVGVSVTGKSSTFRVHRLVWETFRGPIPEGLVINHKDGDPQNNRIGNLECVTTQANILHAFNDLGRRPTGEKLTADMVVRIREDRAMGDSLKTIAKEYGVTATCISYVATGKKWKHVGGPITPSRRMRAKPHEVVARIDSAMVSEVVDRYRMGDGPTMLAREFNVSKRTVLNWVQGKTRQ